MAQTTTVTKPAKVKATPLFSWQGTDKQGNKLTGEQAAASINTVKAILRKQGITPIKVRRKAKPLFTTRKPAIKPVDIAVFSRMLATMVASGVPLMQSLQIIGEGHDNSSMQEMILAITSDVGSGTSLALSLAKFPEHFDQLFINLVNAGEQSGTLDKLLDEIAVYKEKTEALKAKVKKALVYPAVILTVAFAVTVVLMVFVIPQFESLFQGFNADLPRVTKLIINLSQFFQQWWWLILAAIIGCFFAVRESIRRSAKVNQWFDSLLLTIPIIGIIQKKGAIARFARTFSILFKAGIPMIEAMESVAGATGNAVFSKATLAMQADVATGVQLNACMPNFNHLFPNMVIQMVAIGEESGALDTMLAKIADFFEDEVTHAVDNMTTLIEPLIMAFLGVVIGTLVIAMYLPIFKFGAII